MKFSQEILIDLPREEVISKMQNPSSYKDWQRNLLSYKHLSGLPGKEGSRLKLKFRMEGKEIEMVETIVKMVPPKKFHTTYETKGVFNIQKNYFEKLDQNKTRWILDSEYKFYGIKRITGIFKTMAIKKQTSLLMKDFKEFAETGKTVIDSQNG